MNSFFASKRLASPLVSWEIASSVAVQFEVEAKRDGSKCVEAHHMLLALAADTNGEVGKLLKETGLDHERLVWALHEEHRRTLAFAGMNAPERELVEATEVDGTPSFGTSAKAAVRRGMITSRQDRRHRLRLRSTDLFAGILQAELGTVPRALAIAGVDRAALLVRARAAESC